ncbi:FaeA/PapI family transcriptional regulator [Thermofilum pendens]|uniref:Transcriptional regulator n=1 Tax=Thermofilum pendens (strain DSM 2475 / Hrk 5) TaxID=368408 RepID=A1RWR2_THEPD|nr:FaeA/PapI family transcriptional regulator [Thermofilum pendens]ABL77642.1 putative transcriptional regulator [Thermofilum pendens Hrk 5]
MPRKVTDKILERKKLIYEYLKKHGPMPTVELVRDLKLSHSQVFYILRLLLREKKVKEERRGKMAYWIALESEQ